MNTLTCASERATLQFHSIDESIFVAVTACRNAVEIRGKTGVKPAQSRYGELISKF